MELISALSVFSAGLTLAYVLMVAGCIRGWYKLQTYHRPRQTGKTRVAVIVAARNEASVIGSLLSDLLRQDYDKALLEIIVVNDHSTDDTAAIVTSFSSQGVQLINLYEEKAINSYKKKAVQTGIAHSRAELIVTTDADCRMGAEWLKTIVSFYETYHYKLISSPVAFHEEKSWFARCQSLEFAYLIGLGASTIGNKIPGTCNGANLAYERAAFEAVGGFKGIDHLASGDDELLLHKIAARFKGKVGFLKSREAIVYTHAKSTLEGFIRQRKRWASKSTQYKNKGMVALSLLFWLFNFSILWNTILAGFRVNPQFLFMAAGQLIIKIGMELMFLIGVTHFLKKKQLLVLLPLTSTLHIIYILYIGIAGNSGKYYWKGRKVR